MSCSPFNSIVVQEILNWDIKEILLFIFGSRWPDECPDCLKHTYILPLGVSLCLHLEGMNCYFNRVSNVSTHLIIFIYTLQHFNHTCVRVCVCVYMSQYYVTNSDPYPSKRTNYSKLHAWFISRLSLVTGYIREGDLSMAAVD